MTAHLVVIGDSRCMKEVPDESVHLVVTSPPYPSVKVGSIVIGNIATDKSPPNSTYPPE